jgi:hypothetical protein
MNSPSNPTSDQPCLSEIPGYQNLDALMSAPPREEPWIVPGLISKGRITALIGEAKSGKSLLALEVAAAVSAGRPVFGLPTIKTRTLYLDFENSMHGDVIPRLRCFGYKPGDLNNLIYSLHAEFPKFDTAAGGELLARIVEKFDIELVVIDTVSRVVAGEENSNDTWNRFYLNTELALKRANVAVLRIDHVGKDSSKGARGGSAKSGDVDLVIRMTADRSGKIILRLDASRMVGEFETLHLERKDEPLLHHALTDENPCIDFDSRVRSLCQLLDEKGFARGLTNKGTRDAFKELGIGSSKRLSGAVTNLRKETQETSLLPAVENFNSGIEDPDSSGDTSWGWGSVSLFGTSPNLTRPRRGCLR